MLHRLPRSGDTEEAAHDDRYKRIVARPEAFEELLVERFVESHCQAPCEVWLLLMRWESDYSLSSARMASSWEP